MRLAEAVTVLVIEISNKSYSRMWPSSSSSSSGLEIILAGTCPLDEALNQKTSSPIRELENRIYVQWEDIKASLKKRKRCAASLEQTLHVKYITCSGTLFQ